RCTVEKPYPVNRASDNVGLRDFILEKTSTRNKRIGNLLGYCSSPLTDSATYSATSQPKGQRDHPHEDLSSDR
ncbi:hypothetical protein PIB30_104490, partial [Stylosanthes scabra]|nr:hypothetical protein [Stylosanthes scabra]